MSITSDGSPYFKSGEILRNVNGKFAFLCSHCDFVNDILHDIKNHIDEHFERHASDFKPAIPELPIPEFVSYVDADDDNIKEENECTTSENVKIEPNCDEASHELTEMSFTKEWTPEEISEPIVNTEEKRKRGRRKSNTTGRGKPTDSSKKKCDSNATKIRQSCNKCYQCMMEPTLTNQSDPRRHKCVICKEWFPNHVEFETHLKSSHSEHTTDFNGLANEHREFTCYVCEKNILNRSNLIYHVKGHFKEFLKFQCDECGVRVTSKGTLRNHMKRHETTPSQCDVCNKVLSNHFKMKRHRLCHQIEPKYACKVCSKSFTIRKYLNRHMAVHSDTKVSCRYCDKRFSFATSRRAHEKSQHNAV